MGGSHDSSSCDGNVSWLYFLVFLSTHSETGPGQTYWSSLAITSDGSISYGAQNLEDPFGIIYQDGVIYSGQSYIPIDRTGSYNLVESQPYCYYGMGINNGTHYCPAPPAGLNFTEVYMVRGLLVGAPKSLYCSKESGIITTEEVANL